MTSGPDAPGRRSGPESGPLLGRREIAGAAILFAALTALLFFEVVFAGRTVSSAPHAEFTTPTGPVGHPKSRYVPLVDPFGPAWIHEASFPYRDRAVRAGEVPLWQPYEACGNPYWAGLLPGLLFPPNWLMHAAEQPLGFDLAYLARLLLSGLLTYFFLREHRLRRLGALAGGVLYLGSGYMVMSMNLSNAAGEAMIPGVFWGVERLIRRARYRDFALLIGLMAVTMVSGNPQSAFLALAAAAPYALLRLFAVDRAKRARVFFMLAGAPAAAAVFMAPQLVPFLEFLGNSVHLHNAGLGLETQPWQVAIQWLVPDFFRDAYRNTLADRSGYYYIGAGPVVLALLAIGAKGRPTLKWFMLTAWILATAWFFGVPYVEKLGALPGLDRIHLAKYLGAYLCFFPAILGGLAIERLVVERTRRPAAWIVVGIAAVLAIIALYWTAWGRGAFAAFSNKHLALGPDDPVSPNLGWTPYVLAAFALVAIAAWFRRPPAVIGMIALFVIAAEVRLNRPHTYPERKPIYDPPAWLSAIEGDRRTFRVFSPDNVLHANTSAIYGLRDIRYAEALKIGRFTELIARAFDAPGAGNYFPLPGERPRTNVAALARLGVRYVMSDGPLMPLASGVANGYRRELTIPTAGGRLVATVLGGNGHVDVRTLGRKEGSIVASTTLAPNAPLARTRLTGPALPVTHVPYLAVGSGGLELEGTAWNEQRLDLDALSVGAHLPSWKREGDALRIPAPNVLPLPRSTGVTAPTVTLEGAAASEPTVAALVYREARAIATPRAKAGDGFSLHIPAAPTGSASDRTVRSISVEPHGVHLESFAFEPDGLTFVGEYDGVRVYRVDDALPRCFGVYEAEHETDGEPSGLARFLDPTFDPKNRVILPAGAPIDQRTNDAASPARVTIVDEAAGGARVTVDATFAKPGWLVLLDNDYAGWRATVDGTPAEIHRANFTFRAVRVAAGAHRIVFAYRPTNWTLSWLASLGALLALGAGGFVAWRRR